MGLWADARLTNGIQFDKTELTNEIWLFQNILYLCTQDMRSLVW